MSAAGPAFAPRSPDCQACVLPARVASSLGPATSIKGWSPSVGGRQRREGNVVDKIHGEINVCWRREGVAFCVSSRPWEHCPTFSAPISRSIGGEGGREGCVCVAPRCNAGDIRFGAQSGHGAEMPAPQQLLEQVSAPHDH